MQRGSRGAAVIEGVRPVIEAIRAGRRRVLEVSLPARGGTPGLRELRALVASRGIRSRPSPAGEGVVARAEPLAEESFEDLVSAARPRFLVALDRVTDVGNLGSIARTAEGAGATGLVLEYRHSVPIGPGALRASAGALEHLRVARTPNLRKALELAAGEGLELLVADPRGVPVHELDPAVLRRELVWVFGSEDRGVRPGIRELAGRVVGIPHQGTLGSLGVAAAAAYLLLRTAEARRPA